MEGLCYGADIPSLLCKELHKVIYDGMVLGFTLEPSTRV